MAHTAERRLEHLEQRMLPGGRNDNRDPREMSAEELAFVILDDLTGDEVLKNEDWLAPIREAHAHRHLGLRDYLADDDPRLTDPVDLYISDLMRKLLGRFHDKVADPELLIERYRGKFPDRVLESVYYAAAHHEGRWCIYSSPILARLRRLAGLTPIAETDRGQGFAHD